MLLVESCHLLCGVVVGQALVLADLLAGNVAGGELSFAVWGGGWPSLAPGLLVGWQCC